MSSVSKGHRFEEKIFEYFRRLIRNGHYFASPDCCRIYRQKRYYSRDREADITFDLAIEVFMPGSKDYSLLTLVECKDYESPVSVGDVEHLFSRMQQVSGGNTKGIIVATSEFQSSAIAFARSKGIGVVRWFSRDSLKWILKRTPSRWGFRNVDQALTREVYSALTSSQYASPLYEFYCWSDDRQTNSIAELFVDAIRAHITPDAAKLLLADPPADEIVPYRTRESIDDQVTELLSQVGYRGGRVPLEAICEHQRNANGLQCNYRPAQQEESARQTLGHIDLERRIITILDMGPYEADRQRFTLAHELGHYSLEHGEILISERCQPEDVDDLDCIACPANHGLRRMEIQANYFASSLLLPAGSVLQDMSRLAVEFGLRNKGHGLIYLDHQACNVVDYLQVINRLKLSYGASQTAIKYRLQELGLLTEAGSSHRRGSIWYRNPADGMRLPGDSCNDSRVP